MVNASTGVGMSRSPSSGLRPFAVRTSAAASAEFASEKTAIVRDDDFGFASVNRRLRIRQFRLEIIGDALGGEADVLESEFFCDEGAPTGRAEFNSRHRSDACKWRDSQPNLSQLARQRYSFQSNARFFSA